MNGFLKNILDEIVSSLIIEDPGTCSTKMVRINRVAKNENERVLIDFLLS